LTFLGLEFGFWMVELWNSLVVIRCWCQGLVDHHRFHECSFGFCRQSLVVFAMSLFSSIEKIYIGFTVAPLLWPSVGVKPNTWKSWDLESSGTPKCLELDIKRQNTSHWGVLGVIEKVLKRRYRKWPRIDHLDICSQVMGKRRSRSQTGSLTPDH
jgi:hypothetical protein